MLTLIRYTLPPLRPIADITRCVSEDETLGGRGSRSVVPVSDHEAEHTQSASTCEHFCLVFCRAFDLTDLGSAILRRSFIGKWRQRVGLIFRPTQPRRFAEVAGSVPLLLLGAGQACYGLGVLRVRRGIGAHSAPPSGFCLRLVCGFCCSLPRFAGLCC